MIGNMRSPRRETAVGESHYYVVVISIDKLRISKKISIEIVGPMRETANHISNPNQNLRSALMSQPKS